MEPDGDVAGKNFPGLRSKKKRLGPKAGGKEDRSILARKKGGCLRKSSSVFLSLRYMVEGRNFPMLGSKIYQRPGGKRNDRVWPGRTRNANGKRVPFPFSYDKILKSYVEGIFPAFGPKRQVLELKPGRVFRRKEIFPGQGSEKG